MGPEGAANIIFRKEISQAVDPEDERKGKIDLYKEQFAHYVVFAPGDMWTASLNQNILAPQSLRQ